MARAAPSVCSTPGCHELVPCPTHKRISWEGSGHQPRLGKSGWQRQRDNARTMRRNHGICHWCGQPGADQIDHVMPLAEGGDDREHNRQPIHSTPCHEEKRRAEAARARWPR